jgi:hypothetical protein
MQPPFFSESITMKKSHLTPETQAVYDSLTKEQRAIIKKNYPFKGDRNSLLRELKSRKVAYSVLVELSGLSESQIQRLIGKRSNKKAYLTYLYNKLKPYEDIISALNEFVKNG